MLSIGWYPRKISKNFWFERSKNWEKPQNVIQLLRRMYHTMIIDSDLPWFFISYENILFVTLLPMHNKYIIVIQPYISAIPSTLRLKFSLSHNNVQYHFICLWHFLRFISSCSKDKNYFRLIFTTRKQLDFIYAHIKIGSGQAISL